VTAYSTYLQLSSHLLSPAVVTTDPLYMEFLLNNIKLSKILSLNVMGECLALPCIQEVLGSNICPEIMALPQLLQDST
jgi:hypothetical protein